MALPTKKGFPMKVLLTGASGFVGGTFQRVYKDTFEIEALNLRTFTTSHNFNDVDCVLHCAALVHQMQGAPEQEYFDVNFELTKKLALAAKESGVKHFVFISTAHVFGDSGHLYNHSERLNETSSCHPFDAYGKSKIAAELFLQSIQDKNFIVSIIRPPMVYGKGAKGNILSLSKLVKALPIIPLGYTKNRRSLVFVGNLCQHIALVIEKKASGIFLPQDPMPLSIQGIVENLARAQEHKVLIIPIPSFVSALLFKLIPKISLRLFGTLAFDSTVSDEKIGYKPKYTTLDGMRDMLS